MASMRVWVDGAEITTGLKNVSYRRKLDAIDQCMVRIRNVRGAKNATYQAKLGSDCYVRDGSNTYYMFRGILEEIRDVNGELVLLINNHFSQLQDKKIMDSFVHRRGYVKSVGGADNFDCLTIDLEDTAFSDDQWIDSGVLFEEKNFADTELKYCASYAVVGGSSSGGDHGSVHVKNGNSVSLLNNTDAEASITFTFDFDFTTTDCEILTLILWCAYSFSDNGNCTMYVYNYDLADWDEWDDIEPSPITQYLEFDLRDAVGYSGDGNDYMSATGEMKIKFVIPARNDAGGVAGQDYGNIYIYYLEPTVEDEQYPFNPVEGGYHIDDSTATNINTDTAGAALSTTDGIQEGDIYLIVPPNDYILDYLLDTYTDMTPDLLTSSYFSAIECKGTPAFQLFKKLVQMEGGRFWEGTDKKAYVKASFSDSGVDVTVANPVARPEIAYSRREVINKMKILGRTIDGNQVESEWKEDAASQAAVGLKQDVRNDESCRTVPECNARAQAILTLNKSKYDEPASSMRVLAEGSFISQDLLGKTITVTYHDLTAEQLLVEGITASETPNGKVFFDIQFGTQPINQTPEEQMANKLLELHYAMQDVSNQTAIQDWRTAIERFIKLRSGVVYKTADETLSNDATLNDDSHLFFTMEPNSKYAFKFVLFVNVHLTPDIQVALGATNNAVNLMAFILDFVTTGGASSTVSNFSDVFNAVDWSDVFAPNYGGTYDRMLVIDGTVENGPILDILHVKWAQRVSNAAVITVYQGSYVEWKKVD